MAFVSISLAQIKELLRALHRPSTNNSNESNSNELPFISDYPGILSSDLFSPNRAERSVFIITVAILFVLSVCGNILTFFVNIRRKIRPFFRACLISLALSDLGNTFFLSVTYMSQFTAEYVQIWHFGESMCNVVPFMTTCTILVSSMTLVAIAVDRYFAVRINSSEFWNPGCGFSLFCMLLIWAASFGIGCPVFFIYNLFYMYILDEADVGAEAADATTTDWQAQMANSSFSYILVDEPTLVAMCISNKDYVGLYYVIVFAIIFMPCIVAFIWLNTIIAKTIWVRRLPPGTQQATTCSGSSKEHSAAKTNVGDAQSKCSAGNTARVRTTRESRHIRMFIILILMMTVFLLCRLPAWILLLLRMYNTYMKPTQWLLYFSFGALNLLGCVLNPLFYTFLAETIEYVKFVKGHVLHTASGLRLCCIEQVRWWRLRRRRHVATTPSTGSEEDADALPGMPGEELEAPHCFACCCGACGLLHAKLRCSKVQQRREQQQPPPPTQCSAQKTADERSQEKDEGVECDYEASSGASGRQGEPRIYTIAPTSIFPMSDPDATAKLQ